MSKPEEGDVIIHHEIFPEQRRYVGTVVSVLSSQFTYTTKEGEHRFACYTDDWEFYKEQQGTLL